MATLVLLALCCLLRESVALPIDRWGLSAATSTGPYFWFNQTLDHYTATDRRTFPQRYFEITDYVSTPDAPVLLYICGEAPCGGIPKNFVLGLAKHWGAAAVALEHRYYGASMPFPDTSTEHLSFLSTKQALADLANFRLFYQRALCRKLEARGLAPVGARECGGNKWVVVGGSYAGAMSAWLRLKFPHLFHASLASSAVVNVILDFTQFDEQVLESAGSECGAALRQVTSEAESLMKADRARLLSLFQAESIKDDRDFLFLLADAAVFGFQYGQPDPVCVPLVEARRQGGDVLETFAGYVVGVFFKYFGGSPSDYDQEALKDTSLHARSGMRVWYYQCCTEMAFWQDAPKHNSVRSKAIDLQYWVDLCGNVFGPGIFPDTDATNMFYGSTSIAGSRIFFTNGSQDPWKRASKLTSTCGEPSIVVPCHNCGHCVDMRGCPPNITAAHEPGLGSRLNTADGSADYCTNPAAVKRARRIVRDTLTAWLQEPAEGLGGGRLPSQGFQSF